VDARVNRKPDTGMTTLTPIQRQRVLDLCARTRLTYREIASLFDCSEGLVRKIGATVRRAKVAQQRAQARSLREARVSYDEIARTLAVSLRTAQRWTQGGKGRGTREVGAERTTARGKGND
jgi:DNA-directed RNA polymerase specialized sigma24 family protein